jgi:hypothetical protein
MGKMFTIVHRTIGLTKSQASASNPVSRLPPAPTTLPISMTPEEAQTMEVKDKDASCNSSVVLPAAGNQEGAALRYVEPVVVQEAAREYRP